MDTSKPCMKSSWRLSGHYRDMSHINAHYVSQVVTIKSSWKEAVHTAASHMEGVDTTIYLTHHEDA